MKIAAATAAHPPTDPMTMPAIVPPSILEEPEEPLLLDDVLEFGGDVESGCPIIVTVVGLPLTVWMETVWDPVDVVIAEVMGDECEVPCKWRLVQSDRQVADRTDAVTGERTRVLEAVTVTVSTVSVTESVLLELYYQLNSLT